MLVKSLVTFATASLLSLTPINENAKLNPDSTKNFPGLDLCAIYAAGACIELGLEPGSFEWQVTWFVFYRDCNEPQQ